MRSEALGVRGENIKKILIRSTNWIGDAVMTTPAMSAVRATFPDAEIVVVANPIVAELFSHHPFCDRVIIFDKKGRHSGIKGLWNFGREVRSEGFDLAILFQNAIEAAIIAFLGGVPRRAGYRTDGRGLLLTHGVARGSEQKRLHHTSYYLHMLNSLGISGGQKELLLECSEEEKRWAADVMGEGEFVAINPGAAYGSAKRWIPERFAEVADRISRNYGLKVVLTGGPGEMEIGRDIEKCMKEDVLNLVGKTGVRQMMAVISRCRLMITNDSGPMHVGAAFGVPIVAVFGPTDHTTTSPLLESCRIIRKETDCAPCLLRSCPEDHRCMEAITADDVMDGVKGIMG